VVVLIVPVFRVLVLKLPALEIDVVLVVPRVVIPATPRVPVLEVLTCSVVPTKVAVPEFNVSVEILALLEILTVAVVPAFSEFVEILAALLIFCVARRPLSVSVPTYRVVI